MTPAQSILAIRGVSLTIDDAVVVANGNQRDGGPIGKDGIDIWPAMEPGHVMSLTIEQARQLGQILLDLTEPALTAPAMSIAAE